MEFDHKKFLEMFTRTCSCGSKTFRLALEDIDMVPLSMPAYQRVICTGCGKASVQTVSAEYDVKDEEAKKDAPPGKL